MRVYLLRHGATEATAEGRYQGWLDAPLSLAGRRALQRAAFSPQHVYVSPLRRAVETAALWFPEAEQIPVPELREMDFGSFEGYTWRELSGNAAYCAWVDSGCEAPVPGGEGKAIFCARVCAAFAAILSRRTRWFLSSMAVRSWRRWSVLPCPDAPILTGTPNPAAVLSLTATPGREIGH